MPIVVLPQALISGTLVAGQTLGGEAVEHDPCDHNATAEPGCAGSYPGRHAETGRAIRPVAHVDRGG